MPKTITALYHEFEKALAAFEACEYARTDTGKKKYEAALDKADDLADRIVTTPANPANPIPDMLMKIRAAGWKNGTWQPLDEWTECDYTEIVRCLVSLRADLQTMQDR